MVKAVVCQYGNVCGRVPIEMQSSAEAEGKVSHGGEREDDNHELIEVLLVQLINAINEDNNSNNKGLHRSGRQTA